MLGIAGALCCLAAGTAMGSWMKMRRMMRLEMLSSTLEALNAMRMLLETERLPLPELLESSAEHAGGSEGGRMVRKRFCLAAQQLREDPLRSVGQAYAFACARCANGWEQKIEKTALESFFAQLGNGTAAMREQAAAACIRRLKPLCEQAQSDAERSGKLCMQLGALLGLMAGIALW